MQHMSLPGNEKRSNARAACCLIALFWCTSSQAATKWDFSGFGSVGGQQWFGDRYAADYGEPPSGKFDPDWDSILGLQASVMHSNGLGLTAQGVARGHSFAGESPYQPVTEWFFGSWQATDNIRFRVGRLRTPLFMYSESLEVGYTYPWVEPNRHVYKTTYSSASKYDGADISVTHLAGPTLLTWQFFAGKSHSVLIDNPVDIDNARGVTLRADVDTVTLRYAYVRNETTIDNPLSITVANYLRTLSALGPGFAPLAEAINTHDIPQSTHEIGIRWDTGDYTIDAEAIYSPPPGEKLDIESFGTYVGVSRQMNIHTVYGVLGFSFIDLDNDALGILANTQNDVMPGTNPLLDIIRQGLATTLDGYTARDTSLTLGYRYEITESWNAKAEVRHLLLDEDYSPEAYITPPQGAERGRANILRLVTDWVF